MFATVWKLDTVAVLMKSQHTDEKLTMILFSRNKICPAVPEPLLAISVNYAIISGNKNYVR